MTTTQISAPPTPAPPALQFETAEFAAPPEPRACSLCQQPVAESYFEIDGQLACPACAESVRDHGPAALSSTTGAQRFFRALTFGGAGAIVGAGLWTAVTLLTGWQIGLVAIVVGVLVGLGVKQGSRARGGWLYQSMAVVLTYLAIASTYMPEAYKEVSKAAQQDSAAVAEPNASAPAANSAAAEATSAWIRVPVCLAIAAVISLLAPFLGGLENVIGLLILGFALFEAWKLNKRAKLSITGPFRVATDPPPLPQSAPAQELAVR